MIDIEDKIFDLLDTKLKEYNPDIFMSSMYVDAPAEFPCVTVMQKSTTTNPRGLTQEGESEYDNVMFEVNIYSNKCGGKKSEAKAISDIIDSTLLNLNFVRIMSEPVPNLPDVRIYRIVSRYRATVDKNETIYRG